METWGTFLRSGRKQRSLLSSRKASSRMGGTIDWPATPQCQKGDGASNPIKKLNYPLNKKKIETSHHGFRDFSALGEPASGGLGPVLGSLVQMRDRSQPRKVL